MFYCLFSIFCTLIRLWVGVWVRTSVLFVLFLIIILKIYLDLLPIDSYTMYYVYKLYTIAISCQYVHVHHYGIQACLKYYFTVIFYHLILDLY